MPSEQGCAGVGGQEETVAIVNDVAGPAARGRPLLRSGRVVVRCGHGSDAEQRIEARSADGEGARGGQPGRGQGDPAPAGRASNGCSPAAGRSRSTATPSTRRIQMVTVAQRALGLSGLSSGDNPIATRVQNTETTRSFDEPNIHVAETTAVSIPGPAGVIPARHYRPLADAGAPAAGLLPRRWLRLRGPGDPRHGLPADLPGRRCARVGHRLPAGTRAQGPGRRR